MSEPATSGIPAFVTDCVDLAQTRLGARVLSASDEFFAPKEAMLSPEPPIFVPGKYTDRGKWMDGWETRRRRGQGHDHCVVRLGLRGVLKGIDLDTTHYTGNYPQAASLEACDVAGDPDDATAWTELIPATPLRGNSHHYLPLDDARSWTHLRLHIYPDGGVARLRVYGQVSCDWRARSRTEEYDLAAVQNGGRPVAWNDAHFGKVWNLLAPGHGLNMGDGWETRRRREPGHDWAIIELGHPGTISRVEVDTAYFKGNFPDRCSIQAALVRDLPQTALVAQSMFWPVLLPEQRLGADSVHGFAAELASLGPVSHVRFNIIPDGGVSRLRLWGRVQD